MGQGGGGKNKIQVREGDKNATRGLAGMVSLG